MALYSGLTLETDGKDPMICLPVSFALVNFDKGLPVQRRYGLIDIGRPIPEETTKIHNITDEMIKTRGGSLENSIIGLSAALFSANIDKIPIVGMNWALLT